MGIVLHRVNGIIIGTKPALAAPVDWAAALRGMRLGKWSIAGSNR